MIKKKKETGKNPQNTKAALFPPSISFLQCHIAASPTKRQSRYPHPSRTDWLWDWLLSQNVVEVTFWDVAAKALRGLGASTFILGTSFSIKKSRLSGWRKKSNGEKGSCKMRGHLQRGTT